MTTSISRIARAITIASQERLAEENRNRSKSGGVQRSPHIPKDSGPDGDGLEQRWRLLGHGNEVRQQLADDWLLQQRSVYQRNIENLIGTVKVPVGLAGPLRVHGSAANGDYYLPLATTEAALVASYSRGSVLITEAGGCSAVVLDEGVRRTPGFVFNTLAEACRFITWVDENTDTLRVVAEQTTRFGRLIDIKVTVEGNHVYLGFEYLPGDAAGQNMVTIATQAACTFIQQHSPVRPRQQFVEANLSGDKKASGLSFQSVRGKRVSAEVTLPAPLVKQVLHSSPERMLDYWHMTAMGGVLTGSIGIQGHYANGLAALFIACGQDAACVSESAVGTTRFELTEDGSLYAAVTLPNLIVGTIGGGTKLPSQNACLEILGLAGTGNARAFAEVCAGLLLAGELSIAGALTAGHFTQAHQSLARGPSKRAVVAGEAP